MTLSPRMRAAFAEALNYDFRWHREEPMIDIRALDVAVRRFPAFLTSCEMCQKHEDTLRWLAARYMPQIVAEYRYVLREGAA